MKNPIKLSELPDDATIYVNCNEEYVVTKKDYLKYRHDGTEIIQDAVPRPVGLDWFDVIETMSDEQHESWAEDVYNDIVKNPLLQKAVGVINEIFARHQTYETGEDIENDMIGGDPE